MGPNAMIDQALTKKTSIRSELVSYPSRNGHLIRAYLDQPADVEEPRRFIVMSPKYGETKKNNLQLAYHLAANGLCVLRFDQTCHLGESEGEMRDFSLAGGADDILASIDWLERSFGIEKVILLASSLSVRSALRATALTSSVEHCVCLVGVVSLQTTLWRIYGEDLIGNHIKGLPLETRDMFGFDIQEESFFESAIATDMHDLAGTGRDLDRISVPVTYYHAERDAWVDFEEVRQVFDGRSNVRLQRIAGAMHEIKENPKAAEQTFARIVRDCIEIAGGPVPAEVVQPKREELFRQNKIERESLQKLRKQEEDEKEFWTRYLTDYEWMVHSIEYQEYLRRLGALLGGFRSGEVLLDAGCGNGFFGIQYLRDLISTRSRRALDHCLYLGMDLTESGLTAAVMRHGGAMAKILPAAEDQSTLRFIYARGDFDACGNPEKGAEAAMPQFASGTFDKICCSLLLSYLKQPERLVQEFYRLLKPGGRLVMSSMKPNCDLGTIFAEYTRQGEDLEDVKKARALLRSAGLIKVKEEVGIYAFFSEEDLSQLARKAGFRKWEVHRSFGDQANILMAKR